jgi:hypothetical protein
MFDIVVTPENKQAILDWLENRGGVAVWKSVNLSNPGISWFTPARDEDGTPSGKPNWQAASEPDSIVTDPGAVGVVTYKEATRFHIATRLSSTGLYVKLTDGSSRSVRKSVAKWVREVGEDMAPYVTYKFEWDDAVILIPDRVVAIEEA